MLAIRTLPVLAIVILMVGCEGGDGAGSGAEPDPATRNEAEPADLGSYPAKVYEFPGITYLALAEQGPYADFESTVERLVEYLQEMGIEPEGELVGVYFDDPSTQHSDKTLYEIRVPVAEGTKAYPPFVVVKVETEDHAMVRLVGPYEKIRTTFSYLYRWIDENGYVAAGPLWEIYLEHPGTGVKPSEYDTEVHVPVRQKER